MPYFPFFGTTLPYTRHVPGSDYEDYIDTRVCRLEVLCRTDIVEQISASQWRIPDNLASRAATHDAGRDNQASVHVPSPVDLSRQVRSDNAT